METRIVTVVRLIDKHKAKAAFLAPLLTAVGATVASWIVTGQFDATEIRTAAGGSVLALVAGAAAYLGKPGQAEVRDSAPPPPGL